MVLSNWKASGNSQLWGVAPFPGTQHTQHHTFFALIPLCGQSFSCVPLFIPWAVAHQAPLSMGFSRQEYRSGLPCPPPGDLPDPGIQHASPTLVGEFFTAGPPGKPYFPYQSFNSLLFYLFVYYLGVFLFGLVSAFGDFKVKHTAIFKMDTNKNLSYSSRSSPQYYVAT